jgi:hypothetical protein
MKKKLAKKLNLNKQTIVHLSEEDSGSVKGGASAGITCTGWPYSVEIWMSCVGEACFPTGSPCPIPEI